MNDKYETGEIKLEGRFFKWFDNFWYHYKWHTIVTLFVMFVLIVCFAQSCGRESQDMVIAYAGEYDFSQVNNQGALQKAKGELSAALPKDYNSDGEKVVGLLTYHVMTQEQQKAYEEKINADKNNDDIYEQVDPAYFAAQKKEFLNNVMNGQFAILLVDESLCLELGELGRLRKLSDVFATVPAYAVDDYGLRFSETALYQNSPQLGELPEGTVLCLLSPLVVGGTANARAYANMVEMFVAMGK